MTPLLPESRRAVRPPRAPARWVAAAAALLFVAGCSTPARGRDTYRHGRERVVQLLNEAGAALPRGTTFKAVTLADTDREICHRHFLGYAVGETGALQPEVTTFIDLSPGLDGDAVLREIGKHWEALHYRIDRSEAHASQFPKIRAHVGDYTLIATSFKNAPAFNNRMTLYVVGTCQRA